MIHQHMIGQVIDIPIETLFQKYDRDQDGHLERSQLGVMLKDTFAQFGVHKQVLPIDVDNFLVDYNVRHSGDLTRQDFAGIKLIRFTTKETNSNVNASVNNSQFNNGQNFNNQPNQSNFNRGY